MASQALSSPTPTRSNGEVKEEDVDVCNIAQIAGPQPDTIIKCHGWKWSVNDRVLCKDNRIMDAKFRACCMASFQSGYLKSPALTSLQENGVPTLLWDSEDPFAVEVLIDHCYTGLSFARLHSRATVQPLTATKTLEKMVLVLQIATEYVVRSLRDPMMEEIDQELDNSWQASEYVKLVKLFWGKNIFYSPEQDRRMLLHHGSIHHEELGSRGDFWSFLNSNINFSLESLRFVAGSQE